MAAGLAARRASDVPGNDAGAGPPHTRLRTVLADHLRRSRGIALDPDDLLVVPGVAASLRALPEALGIVGRTAVLEDPGYVEAVTAWAESGVRVRTVPVDEDGLDPGTLREDDAAVYVTPSHQYPSADGCRSADVPSSSPGPSGRGRSSSRTTTTGSSATTSRPCPRSARSPTQRSTSSMSGPRRRSSRPACGSPGSCHRRHLRDPLRVALELRGLVVNEATGAALAEFIASGALAAHQARATRTYAARRAALVGGLARHLPELTVQGVDAGLHVVLRLPEDADDLATATDLLRRGLAASPLSAYCVDRTLSGLVLCYAGLPESQADAAAAALAAVLRARVGERP